ncbi:MAG: 2-octaprenyl-6-methoxyphenyl hydroxylase [Acidiferrobacterales bacterium]
MGVERNEFGLATWDCWLETEFMADYDIVIVGGGLVGLSLACALGRSDLSVAVIESADLTAALVPSDDARTLALAYGSKRIFEGIGVWSDIQARGVTPIKRIHVSNRGHFGVTRLNAAGAGIEALGYVVEMPVLGAVLYQTLAAFDSIHVISPATMEKITFGNDAVSLDVGQRGLTKTITARLIVGADGGRSRVREAVGIDARRVDYGQSAIVANISASIAHGNVAYERFTDSGPLALLPMRDNRCTVVWSARTREVDTILGWDDNAFLQRLQERFGDRLGRFCQVSRRQAYPLYLTRVDEHVCARAALVGNAAHTVHPVAGQGFNLGLRDVATLSEVLVDATRAGHDIGDVQVLAQYMKLRERDTAAVTAFTDGLIRIFANSFAPLAFARNLGLIATDLLPPLKRALIRRSSGLAGRLPRLARGLPL